MNLDETLRVVPELLRMVELANGAVWVLTRKINGKRLKEEHEAPMAKAIAFVDRAQKQELLAGPFGDEDRQAHNAAMMACADLEWTEETADILQKVAWALRGWDEGAELQLARDFFMSMSATYSALLDEILWDGIDKRLDS